MRFLNRATTNAILAIAAISHAADPSSLLVGERPAGLDFASLAWTPAELMADERPAKTESFKWESLAWPNDGSNEWLQTLLASAPEENCLCENGSPCICDPEHCRCVTQPAAGHLTAPSASPLTASPAVSPAQENCEARNAPTALREIARAAVFDQVGRPCDVVTRQLPSGDYETRFEYRETKPRILETTGVASPSAAPVCRGRKCRQ